MKWPNSSSGDDKILNENLSPLRRYLERQVGRPWDKVYAEIARRLRADNTVQQHVRHHLADFVAVKPRRRSGTLSILSGAKKRYDWLWFEPLYVDPRDGLLKRTDRLREAKAERQARRPPPAPPDRIGLTADRELRRIEGLWFEVTLAPLPQPEYRAFREVRARRMSDMVWVIRAGSRWSGMSAASVSIRSRRLSAPASSRTPPSELI